MTAFSLYSAIPFPKPKWDGDSMKYALCFFPLIGVVIGALQILWASLGWYWQLEPGLYAAVAVAIPLLVTGGIHVDGFVDTCDAVSSHAPPERKREILKDPHVGAFGVIFCAVSFLLQYGLWQQLYQKPKLLALAALGYVASRSLNGLSIAVFPCSQQSGLVHMFNSGANRRAAAGACGVLAAGSLVIGVVLSPVWGGAALVFSAGYFWYHYRFCMREFGGNSGDLAGFLLQNLELGYLILAAAGGIFA